MEKIKIQDLPIEHRFPTPQGAIKIDPDKIYFTPIERKNVALPIVGILIFAFLAGVGIRYLIDITKAPSVQISYENEENKK
jgi:hypothetical protein